MFRFYEKSYIVYLAGKIKKTSSLATTTEQAFGWGKAEIAEVNEGLSPHKIIGLNPADRIDDIRMHKAVYGKDLLMVLISDAVLVDARTNCGMGIGVEMAIASMNNIPIVTVIPPDTAYHKFHSVVCGQLLDEYKHPFAWTVSDKVVPSFKEMGQHLLASVQPKHGIQRTAVDKKTLDAIKHYFLHSYDSDTHFIDLCNQFSELKSRVEYFENLVVTSKPLSACL